SHLAARRRLGNQSLAGFAAPARGAETTYRSVTFPSICHAWLVSRHEDVSNECLKINQSFEIGGDRETYLSIQVRGQIYRGGGGGGRERAMRLFPLLHREVARVCDRLRDDIARYNFVRGSGLVVC